MTVLQDMKTKNFPCISLYNSTCLEMFHANMKKKPYGKCKYYQLLGVFPCSRVNFIIYQYMLHILFGDDQICLLSPISFRKLSCCEKYVHRSSKSQIIPTVNTGTFQQLPPSYLPSGLTCLQDSMPHTQKSVS